jgi:ABC-type branched-subunit amino acid transport system ATPase component
LFSHAEGSDNPKPAGVGFEHVRRAAPALLDGLVTRWSRISWQRADDPLTLLSYRERRQLELALALNTHAKVPFLDEPCAGLSPSGRQRIFKMIRALPREITLVMIEHDMDVALGLADRVRKHMCSVASPATCA